MAATDAEPRWLLLIHQIPPAPAKRLNTPTRAALRPRSHPPSGSGSVRTFLPACRVRAFGSPRLRTAWALMRDSPTSIRVVGTRCVSLAIQPD